MSVPYQVTFNGYLLQNASYRTQIIQHTQSPDRDIQTEARARADGSIIVNTRFTQKVIDVEGQLTATDRASLVAMIDQMKLNLNGISANLDIDYGDSVRRYFATVSALEIDEDFYNINFVPYKITFMCADPFGYPTNSGVANINGINTLLYDLFVTVSGTINSNPVLFLTINSGTVNANLIRYSNEMTGELIIVTKPGAANFNVNDQIVINSRNKQVMINGSGLDYTGRFPTMNPSVAQLRVAVNGTSINYNLSMNYLPAYL